MAYYMNKNRKKTEQQDKPKASKEMKSFYQIMGCVIVLIVVLIIWAVRG